MIAEHAGTCFGVRNAISIAFDAAEKNGTYITGDLVHNPQVVAELSRAGVKTISELGELKRGDRLIIRAHGEPKTTFDHCEKNGIEVIDASCPFVKRAQRLAVQMEEEGYKVILIGDREHPEVKSIIGRTENGVAYATPEELCKEDGSKIGILSQTTQTKERFIDMVSKLVANAKEAKVHNTICSATTQRQEAAVRLAKEVDAMVVVGGKNSANTKKLYELCSSHVNTYWVSTISELDPTWFSDSTAIGLTAGASTPESVIREFESHLTQL